MKKLFDFLDKGVSPYHAVHNAVSRLEQEGFEKLEEMQTWELVPGGKYFVTRNGSGIVAFVVPKERLQYYHMTACHSDSPTFRIKKNKVEGKYYAKAETETYGGMIMSSWMDRPLTFAGRVIVKTPDGIETRLVTKEEDIFVIPNLAIHFNREINKGYQYNPQVDLQPIYGGEECDLETVFAEEEILDMDIVLAVRQKASYLGVDKAFYIAPRIDDLAGAYATLSGFLEALPISSEAANVWCMFDNEEVGSSTRQGAMSDFLPQVLSRLENALLITEEERCQVRSKSLLISVDNAHATHPNLPAKCDSEFPVVLNKGIVIKYNASQKYTTTGMTAAVFAELCKKCEVPVQKFANRADMPGGSTLGNLLSQGFSVPMLDIGLPQLAMHSAVETAGCQDVSYMVKAIKAFYESSVCQLADGKWQI